MKKHMNDIHNAYQMGVMDGALMNDKKVFDDVDVQNAYDCAYEQELGHRMEAEILNACYC